MVVLPNIDEINKLDLTQPLALDPKNFTALHRTPWAGQQLASGIKSRFAADSAQKIGESWEVSCDPDAPSKLLNHESITLSQVIANRTTECLSKELVKAGRTTCEILLKLLNAASPLSLQIHPSDNNSLLKANECGKPESWLVLSAEPNCGLYLGFSKYIPKQEIESLLKAGTFDSKLLQFVPVKAGDYFEIEPHVPHAIGPGIVLLEPQRIIAGKSGKTWRLWDWQRKYNSKGEEDPKHGTARELHISESMSLLEPQQQFGSKYVDSLRRIPKIVNLAQNSSAKIFPPNSWYQTIILDLKDKFAFKMIDVAKFACVTIISGEIESKNAAGKKIKLSAGESFFFGAESLPTEWANLDSHSIITLVIPAGPGVEKHEGLIFKI